MSELIVNLQHRGMDVGPALQRLHRWTRQDRDPADAFEHGSFLDELAVINDKEPLQFLLSMLASGGSLAVVPPQHPVNIGRMRNVLLLAAARSGWRSPLPMRQGRGIAAHHTRLSYIGAVARVSVADNGRVRVPRIDLAVDCGMVTDAEKVTEALKGAACTALCNALHAAAFNRSHDVERVAGANDAPDIRIHIVRSEEPFGDNGEVGVAPVMAAVVNAVFAATGQRARALPVDPALLRLH